jgi:hypothetical protein
MQLSEVSATTACQERSAWEAVGFARVSAFRFH